MITKQSLQHDFPDFSIHHARFTQTEFYMLVKDQIHFHVDVDKESEDVTVLVYVEGDKIKELIANSESMKELVNELKTITRDYDNTGS